MMLVYFLVEETFSPCSDDVCEQFGHLVSLPGTIRRLVISIEVQLWAVASIVIFVLCGTVTNTVRPNVRIHAAVGLTKANYSYDVFELSVQATQLQGTQDWRTTFHPEIRSSTRI